MTNLNNIAKLALAGCTLRGMYVGARESKDGTSIQRGIITLGGGLFGWLMTPIEITGRILDFVDPSKN